jgi:hypothetical protein
MGDFSLARVDPIGIGAIVGIQRCPWSADIPGVTATADDYTAQAEQHE